MRPDYYARIRREFSTYRDAKLHQATHGGYIMQLDDGRCLHYALGYTRWEAMEDAQKHSTTVRCRTFGFNEPNGYAGDVEQEFLQLRNMPA